MNWYKLAKEYVPEYIEEGYDPEYVDIAHPYVKDKKEMDYWGDVYLWAYKFGGNIKTYKLSTQIRTHDQIKPLIGNFDIWGRFSLKKKIASMSFYGNPSPFVVSDAALQLEELIGKSASLYVSGSVAGKEINQTFPSIENFIKQITPKSMRVAQTAEQLQQQYNDLSNSYSVNITGTGQAETLQIPGGQSINAGELLRQALNTIQHILVKNGVKEVNTDPLYNNPQAQGLAVSHEPGVIHIDIKKIVEQAKGSLPPVAQLDGAGLDPDIANNIVSEISNYILAEIGETLSHESQHVLDYQGAIQQGNPFASVQEAPAEQFGQQTRQQYFGV